MATHLGSSAINIAEQSLKFHNTITAHTMYSDYSKNVSAQSMFSTRRCLARSRHFPFVASPQNSRIHRKFSTCLSAAFQVLVHSGCTFPALRFTRRRAHPPYGKTDIIESATAPPFLHQRCLLYASSVKAKPRVLSSKKRDNRKSDT